MTMSAGMRATSFSIREHDLLNITARKAARQDKIKINWHDKSIDLYDNEKYVGPAIKKIVEWFNRYMMS